MKFFEPTTILTSPLAGFDSIAWVSFSTVVTLSPLSSSSLPQAASVKEKRSRAAIRPPSRSLRFMWMLPSRFVLTIVYAAICRIRASAPWASRPAALR